MSLQLKLEGLYREGKLDLLSLVQYSTLALTVLRDTLHSTHSLTQTGRAPAAERMIFRRIFSMYHLLFVIVCAV